MMDKNKNYQQYMYNYPHKKSYRPFEKISIHSLKEKMEKNPLGLYLHIPFCQSRCGYCNLFSLAGENTELMSRYVARMEEEARFIGESMNLNLDSFIIGGGTPLYLEYGLLDRVLSLPEKYFNRRLDELFVGIETSPRDTTDEKLELLKDKKVDRISMGVQSFIDSELANLGRNHRVEDIENSLAKIKSYNFPILNLDLIYGIEGQTEESLLYSLKKVLAYDPEEVFIYPLYIRENKKIKASDLDSYQLYELARDFLLEEGYSQQSMRRFTKGKIVETSCGFGNSLSLGSGGRSYIGNLHYCKKYSDRQLDIKSLIEDYIAETDLGKIDYGIYLNREEEKRLFLIKNLFVVRGLDIGEYKNIFGKDLFLDFKILEEWIEEKYLFIEDAKLKPSKLGLGLSDFLGPKLISVDIRNRMDSWVDSYER